VGTLSSSLDHHPRVRAVASYRLNLQASYTPEIIKKEEEYKIEAIRKHRKRGNSTQYLVH